MKDSSSHFPQPFPTLLLPHNRKIYKDEERAAKHGMSREEMKGAWRKFVDYVLEVVKKDFRQYKSAPEGTYGTIQANKPTVQNVRGM